VTVTRKILLSAAIMAAGFGIAALLGKPSAPPPPAWTSSADAMSMRRMSDAPASHVQIGVERLVPDTRGGADVRFQTNDDQRARDAHSLSARQATIEKIPGGTEFGSWITVAPTPENMTGNGGSAGLKPEPAPRARLLDEAPRALTGVPHGEVSNTPTQTGEVSLANVERAPPPASRPLHPDGVVTAQWTRDNAARDDLATPFGANSTASSQVAERLFPLPMPHDVANDARTHIVVDGDSLAKLAGRYLDDPRRAAEIYEHNRHLLNDPELLPIGVELMIPPRRAPSEVDALSPQAHMPRAVAIHAPLAGGLVPVRPVPAASIVTPRAFLKPPLAAD
jgi:nucleoid-associated protein YgaU